jgi:non-ribosomal peptide synthetase component F
MLIAILATLKVGAAYVPMDPSYPNDRISYILQDTNTKLVLTNEVYKERLEEISLVVNTINSGYYVSDTTIDLKHGTIGAIDHGTRILSVDSEEVQGKLSSQLTSNPKTATTSTNLAYVIYTSGTTGNPKGVMVEHRGVTSLVKNTNYITIDSNDSFIQLADIAFDAATFEIWGSLLNGAQLVIPDNKINLLANINLFQKILIVNKISVLWLTKTLFDQLFLEKTTIFKEIKYLLVGGEALNKELIFLKKLII